MENLFTANQMRNLAFKAWCQNPEFRNLVDTTINVITEKANKGYMSVKIPIHNFPILTEKNYRDAFKTHLRSLGFNTEDVVRIVKDDIVLNYVKVSWYVFD